MSDSTERVLSKQPRRPLTQAIRDSWGLAWSLGRNRVTLYANSRIGRILHAWRPVGVKPVIGTRDDLLQAGWDVITRRRMHFQPESYDAQPDVAAFYFFRRPIDEIIKLERKRAEKAKNNNFRVINGGLLGNGSEFDPLALTPDPSMSTDELALYNSYLRFLGSHNERLAEVGAFVLYVSNNAHSIASHFNKSETWARDRLTEMREAYTQFMATGQ